MLEATPVFHPVHAEQGLVEMGVRLDQPGQEQCAAAIFLSRSIGGKFWPDRGDASFGDGDIGGRLAQRTDVADDEIGHGLPTSVWG